MDEVKKANPKPRPKQRPRKKVQSRKKNNNFFRMIMTIIVIIAIVAAIVLLVGFIKGKIEDSNALKEVHEDVSLSPKEKSYYDLLLKTMNEYEDIVTGVNHVYFNLYTLPGLKHDEKENVAKKVLHSFKIHKDKELLIDTFDGLYFRGILNIETSELDGAIYVTFEDLKNNEKLSETEFAISIYKSSDINPKVIYKVKLDDDKKIVSYEHLKTEIPNEVTTDKMENTEEKDD